jgi:DNA-binding transcriptional ArsR family regulator
MDDNSLTPVWKALADPTRRRILDLLKERPRTTGELTAAFEADLSRFGVMKHLAALEESGLVLVRPKGRERWNYLNAVPLQQIYERWLRPYEAEWAGALLSLKRQAESAGEAATMNTDVDFFETEQEVVINAERGSVFDRLLDVDAWWSHRYADDSKEVRLEPFVGGRFYEVYDGDDGVLYATVSSIKRGEHLHLTGSAGMPGAVFGIVRFDLEERDGGTVVKLSHRAFGQIGEERKRNYTKGWGDLLNERLKRFVEEGVRYR